jgi:hypothetical protein
MRPRARDNHRELPAMRAVPHATADHGSHPALDRRIKQQMPPSARLSLSYRPAGRSPQPASACSDRRSRLH